MVGPDFLVVSSCWTFQLSPGQSDAPCFCLIYALAIIPKTDLVGNKSARVTLTLLSAENGIIPETFRVHGRHFVPDPPRGATPPPPAGGLSGATGSSGSLNWNEAWTSEAPGRSASLSDDEGTGTAQSGRGWRPPDAPSTFFQEAVFPYVWRENKPLP